MKMKMTIAIAALFLCICSASAVECGETTDDSTGPAKGKVGLFRTNESDIHARINESMARLRSAAMGSVSAGSAEAVASDEETETETDETVKSSASTTAKPLDTDRDGVYDMDASGAKLDNCPETYNPQQEDMDGDGVGDWCDNCRKIANEDQIDADEDGIGDTCIIDTDADGVTDDMDNCRDIANSEQANEDRDRMGDACDPDYVAPSESPEEPVEDDALMVVGNRDDGCTLVAAQSAGLNIFSLFMVAFALSGLAGIRKLF